MSAKCIVCKKELPEGAKLPICEYHKGVAADNAKGAAAGAIAIALSAGVAAKDRAIPFLKEKGIPAIASVVKHIGR